jgi:hypothetical protein
MPYSQTIYFFSFSNWINVKHLCAKPWKPDDVFKDLILTNTQFSKDWWNGSSSKSACLASMKPWVQTPPPKKKGKKEMHSLECIFIILWHPSISRSSYYNYKTTTMNYKFIKNKEFSHEICNCTIEIQNRKKKSTIFILSKALKSPRFVLAVK